MQFKVKKPFNLALEKGRNVRRKTAGSIVNIDDEGIYKGLKASGYIEDFLEEPQAKMKPFPENKMKPVSENKTSQKGRGFRK